MFHKEMTSHLVEALARVNEHVEHMLAKDGRWKLPHARGFTIALSREVGARASEVAREAGARLGWPVYDHELLERIAQDMHVNVHLLELVDEKPGNWLQECIEAFSLSPTISESAYFKRLLKLMISLGLHGDCIIVGRGAAQLLPERSTLRVRLMANREDRINVIRRAKGMSRGQAIHFIDSTDHEHVRFVQEHFLKDPGDPNNYDLILNTSRFSIAECGTLIIDALDRMMHRHRHGVHELVAS